MSETPNSPPPAPSSGGKGLILGAVVLAGVAAAGAAMFMKKDGAPPATAPKEASAPAKPVAAPPAPVAPKVFSESVGDIEIVTTVGRAQFKGVKSVNASLTKDEVVAALKGDLALLAKLDAEALTAETVTWAQEIGKTKGNTTYSNVEAKGIKGGVISLWTAASSSSLSQSAEKREISSAIDAISIQNFDIPLLVRWFTETDPEGKAPLKTLHSLYQFKSMKMSMEGLNIDAGAFTLSDSKLRPARRAVSTLLGELNTYAEQERLRAEAEKNPPKPDAAPAAGEAPKLPPKPDDTKMLITLVDLSGSFELGKGSVDGIKIAAIEPKDEGPSSGEIRKISFAGGPSGFFGLEGIGVTGKDGKMSLGKVETRGDLTTLLLMAADKGLRESTNDSQANKELQDVIRARVANATLPDISLILEALAGDFPNTKGKPEDGRMAFSLGRFSLTSGGFVALTPTRVDYVIDKLDVPLPKDSNDATIIALRESGMERMTLAARLNGSWAEATQSFSLKELSVDIAQLARLAISSEIGNVPRAFFEDPKTNWPSAMGATINALVMDVENRGGLAKLTDVLARQQKKTGEQMRKEFASIAPLIIAGMLSGHPDSGKVAQAAADFIRNLNSLHLKVTAAGPNGIVLTDLATASRNPAEFAQKLRFEIEGK